MRLPKPVKQKKAKRRGSRTSAHRKARAATFKSCVTLWSKVIRKGNPPCHFAGKLIRGEPHACKGPIQACHGFPKKVYPASRYSLWNGIPACAAAHSYFTWREPEWFAFLNDLWGPDLYAERLAYAMSTPKHDLNEVAERLRAELVAA